MIDRKALRQDMQRRLNERHWDQQRERGLTDQYWVAFSSRQRFEELNRATWYIHSRLIVLAKHLSAYERSDIVRRVRLCIAAARGCDRPALP